MSGGSNPPPVKKNWFARHKILTTLLILFIIGALGSGGKTPPPTTAKVDAPKQEEKKVEEPKNKPTISMEEFTTIQNGMTYDKVVEIVGGPGELSSESQFGNLKTSLYTFKGDKVMSNANITVQNGKVSMKAQFGL